MHRGIHNPDWLILCICGRVLFDPDQRHNAERASTDRREIKGKILTLLCCSGHLFLVAGRGTTWSLRAQVYNHGPSLACTF